MAARRSREPLRTCVGCRRVRAKRSLVRIVHYAGGVVVDRAGRVPGRGAYVCDDPACLRRAKGKLAGALRVNVDFTSTYEQLVV